MEVPFRDQHLKLEDLRNEPRAAANGYLFNNVNAYPRPEIHVSYLNHDTDQQGLEGICKDGGFKAFYSLQWWSLAVRPEDIVSAEARLLDETYPDRNRDQIPDQDVARTSFLGAFADSPAFLATSRYGSYRFTFPVEAVLEAYSQQFCSGAKPILQVCKTVLYKQEVMYVVLVDRPDRERHPLLADQPKGVCEFRDGRFLWRPESMSNGYRYELFPRPGENQMEAKPLERTVFYVWDHVAIALSMDSGEVLNFDSDQLREKLTFCGEGKPRLSTFQGFDEAQTIVKELWPDFPGPLEKERSLGPTAP